VDVEPRCHLDLQERRKNPLLNLVTLNLQPSKLCSNVHWSLPGSQIISFTYHLLVNNHQENPEIKYKHEITSFCI